MKQFKIALQIYSIKEEAEKDFEATLKKIRSFGYDGVELAGLYGNSPEQVHTWLVENNLECISAHISYNALCMELEETVKVYKMLGCRYIAIPALDESSYSGSGYEELLMNITMISNVCKKEGIQLLYHNHAEEFEMKNDQGDCWIDDLYEKTKPEELQTEFDTGWVQIAGQDPAAYILKYKNRSPVIHVKDYNSIDPIEFCSVGNGKLRLKELLKAAEEANTEWLVVEQDTHMVQTKMEDVAKSVEYLKQLSRTSI
jgi:sugar phosphate isomerase/epimerase